MKQTKRGIFLTSGFNIWSRIDPDSDRQYNQNGRDKEALDHSNGQRNASDYYVNDGVAFRRSIPRG
jgi:hypothetical protein